MVSSVSLPSVSPPVQCPETALRSTGSLGLVLWLLHYYGGLRLLAVPTPFLFSFRDGVPTLRSEATRHLQLLGVHSCACAGPRRKLEDCHDDTQTDDTRSPIAGPISRSAGLSFKANERHPLPCDSTMRTLGHRPNTGYPRHCSNNRPARTPELLRRA